LSKGISSGIVYCAEKCVKKLLQKKAERVGNFLSLLKKKLINNLKRLML
jgi:hypothetical protein